MQNHLQTWAKRGISDWLDVETPAPEAGGIRAQLIRVAQCEATAGSQQDRTLSAQIKQGRGCVGGVVDADS